MTETPHLITLQHQLAEKFEIPLPESTFEQFSIQLTAWVKNLIVNDMNKLLYILYRVDVEEEKMLKIIRENSIPHGAQLIADALISRQLQKIEQRQTGTTPSDIPEDEKW
jgi:hypothetical protein